MYVASVWRRKGVSDSAPRTWCARLVKDECTLSTFEAGSEEELREKVRVYVLEGEALARDKKADDLEARMRRTWTIRVVERPELAEGEEIIFESLFD